MAAVMIGGGVNIFGDWFFVFPLGLGMTSAAMATVLGTTVQEVIMCSHFFTKKCTLRFVKPHHVMPAVKQTLSIDFGASVLDLGTVILAIIMNNLIMRYGDTTALAVYGVVATPVYKVCWVILKSVFGMDHDPLKRFDGDLGNPEFQEAAAFGVRRERHVS